MATRKAGVPRKVALVTGATSGIGKAAALGIAKTGAHVILLVRDTKRGEAAMAEIRAQVPDASLELLEGDVASQKSVRKAAQTILARPDRLEIIVHSAGVFLPDRTVTEDGVETTFATNYLGQFLLTQILVPLLKESAPARVVFVASRYGGARIDFEDLNFEHRKFSYLKVVPSSKLAQVLYMQELAERLAGTGVTVNAVHPGLVAKTKLLEKTGGPFRSITNLVGGTPEKGADTAVWLATATEAEGETGGLWAKRKRMKTPGQGSDPAARKRLWEESERMTSGKAGPARPPKAVLAT
jgi:NAD(P)-dependent dehydrogenase (short-subunit alcohol dehydrogenase family)